MTGHSGNSTRSRARARTTGIVSLAVVLLGVAILGGAMGGAAAAPAGSASALPTFAALASPVAVAATPDAVLALSSASCATVYAVAANGAVSTFATLKSSLTKCPEGALAISPGLGNFPAGEVYVLQAGHLFEIPAGGSGTAVASALTLSNLSGSYDGLAFDYTGSFGYALLATGGKYGDVYAISPANQAHLIGAFGTTVEGPAVAPMSFGTVGGDLLIAGESHSEIYAMGPSGTGSVVTFASWPNSEAVSFVPTLACSFSTTGDAYFVADKSANAILAYPSSTFGAVRGSGLVLGEYKGLGSGLLSTAGATTSFLPLPGTLEGASYVACPVGVVQAVDLKAQHLDGSYVNLIGFDPVTRELVGVDPTNASSEIFLLNGQTGAFQQLVAVGLDPSSVTYNAQSNELIVADAGSGNLTLLDATSFAELGSISTGAGSEPVSVAFNAHNEKLYVANAQPTAPSLEVFSFANNLFPNQNQITPLGGIPIGVVVDPQDTNAYVAGNVLGVGTVWEFHVFNLVNTLSLAGTAASLAVSTLNTTGTLYVTLPSAGELALLGPGDLLTAYAAVPDPVGAAYDGANGFVFVASGNGDMYILDGTAIVASFPLGQNPGPLVYDPVSQLVYVAADVTVSSIDPRIILGGSSG